MRRIFQNRNWQGHARTVFIGSNSVYWLERHTMNPWKNQYQRLIINLLSMIKSTNAKRSICAGLRQYFNVAHAQHIKQTASLFHHQNWFKIYRNLSFSFKIHQKSSFWLKIYRKSIYLTKPWIDSKPQKKSVFKTSCIQGL